MGRSGVVRGRRRVNIKGSWPTFSRLATSNPMKFLGCVSLLVSKFPEGNRQILVFLSSFKSYSVFTHHTPLIEIKKTSPFENAFHMLEQLSVSLC